MGKEQSEKSALQASGVGPLIDPVADLAHKSAFEIDSWFVIGHVNSGDQVLDYLLHLMVLKLPGNAVVQSVVSVTNETTGWYRGADVLVPLENVKLSEEGLDLSLPNGRMVGDLGGIHLTAQLDGASVDVRLEPDSGVLFNGATGVFPMLGMTAHQYSVPRFTTSGTITIEGQELLITGTSWLDRQWQNLDGASTDSLHWTWMGLNLDNGDAMSLWMLPDASTGQDRAWATVLHADGTQTVTAAEPSLGARDLWRSEQSGQNYPTRWTVRIPALDVELEVVPVPREQEIVSQVPMLHKYEGASRATGTYGSRPVTGVGYVELVGNWRD